MGWRWCRGLIPNNRWCCVESADEDGPPLPSSRRWDLDFFAAASTAAANLAMRFTNSPTLLSRTSAMDIECISSLRTCLQNESGMCANARTGTSRPPALLSAVRMNGSCRIASTVPPVSSLALPRMKKVGIQRVKGRVRIRVRLRLVGQHAEVKGKEER